MALLPTTALAQNAVQAGDLVVDRPTLTAAGLAWFVIGDANNNATVSLEYRAMGSATWRSAQPLLRVENQMIGEVHPGNLLAGSVFGLVPGGSYELRATLSDPDGGSAQQTVTVTTRAEPPATSLTNIRYVVPGDGGGSGTAADPFRGLAAADEAANPGDVFVLAPGTYARVRLTHDGSPGAPITYRGETRDTVFVDGAGESAPIVDAGDRQHIVIEHLMIRNGQTAIAADNSTQIVIREITAYDIRRITSDPVAIRLGGASRDGYVCDNVLLGPAQWGQRIDDSFGVKVSGAGTVVCFNRIERFWDNIGMANAGGANAGIAIDIYGNILLQATDDGIETDYAQRNIRVFGNLISGSLKGVTAQPVYGGPVYIIRNEIFDTESSPYKFHATTAGRPSGLLVYHNSTAAFGRAFSGGEWFNGHFRNNLFYGSSGYVMETLGAAATFDYNGWCPKQTPQLKLNGIRYDTINKACGNPSVEDFCGSTGNEVHAIEFQRSEWVLVPEPEGWAAAAPRALGDWDFGLAAGAKAVDSAVVLPNINDVFVGAAPDRGALERGSTPTHYGPRTDAPGDPTLTDAGVDSDGGTDDPNGEHPGDLDAGCACSSGRSAPHDGFLAVLLLVVLRRRRNGCANARTSSCRLARMPVHIANEHP